MLRFPAWLLLALLPSGILAWQNRNLPQLGVFPDDSVYWVTAKSLAEGGGYRIASLPDQPPQTKYPPLFPLLLSLVWRVDPHFPSNLPLAALVVWILFPVFLYLVKRLFEDWGLSQREARWLTVAVGLSPVAVLFSYSLMSEVFFSVWLYASLLTAERAKRDNSRRIALLAGLAGGAAFLTRSAGLPLLLTAPLAFWLDRRRRLIPHFLAGMAPPVAGWLVWTRFAHNTQNDVVHLFYTNSLGLYIDALRRVRLDQLAAVNLIHAAQGISRLVFFNPVPALWSQMLAAVIAALAIAGAVRMFRSNGRKQAGLFAIGFVALAVAWNYPPNERLLFPMLPLVAGGAWWELKRLWGSTRRYAVSTKVSDRAVARLFQGVLGAGALAAVGLAALGLFIVVPSLSQEQQAINQRSAPVHEWLRANTDPNAPVYANNDVLLYLHSGRHAFRWIMTSPVTYTDAQRREEYERELSSGLRQMRASYAVWIEGDERLDLGDSGDKALGEMLRRDPDCVEVWRSPGAVIYRVSPKAER